jgi:hypothetical protein
MRNFNFLIKKSNFASLGFRTIEAPVSTFYNTQRRFLYNKKDDMEEFGIYFYFYFYNNI